MVRVRRSRFSDERVRLALTSMKVKGLRPARHLRVFV
jgi:hypothetical protein